MDRPQSPPELSDPHRGLRIVAICNFLPALALLLPCGLVTSKTLPALGIAPMFFSAAFQIASIGSRPRMPKTTVCINLFLAAFLFSVLLPSWIFMAERRLKHWSGTDWTMLGAYGTMPLMVNFVIHSYLALQAFLTIQWSRRSGPGCCCDSDNGCLRPDGFESFTVGGKDGDEVREPMMKYCDELARPSTEFQTSGFNTPRVSQETLESSVGS